MCRCTSPRPRCYIVQICRSYITILAADAASFGSCRLLSLARLLLVPSFAACRRHDVGLNPVGSRTKHSALFVHLRRTQPTPSPASTSAQGQALLPLSTTLRIQSLETSTSCDKLLHKLRPDLPCLQPCPRDRLSAPLLREYLPKR